VPRHTTDQEQLTQHVHHVTTREPPTHFQRQALTRELILDRQDLEPPAVDRLVAHEVVRPHMVDVPGTPTRHAVLARTQPRPLDPLPRHTQVVQPPQPMHAVATDPEPFVL
jgi:hypothetical protein